MRANAAHSSSGCDYPAVRGHLCPLACSQVGSPCAGREGAAAARATQRGTPQTALRCGYIQKTPLRTSPDLPLIGGSERRERQSKERSQLC
ncbi:unnamed protein product [Arctia plantaginis]|uniref:Uncharacterized protein n=1 Tax=Arctia plantaginis TaxID=874455 RepID=A0A8S1ATC9_ARCPL|nr:unnamed protein product [Arctia plantaginis]